MLSSISLTAFKLDIMEKCEIQYRFKNIKNLADFAKLLNDVKTDEFKTAKYKITEAQLLHFCNSKTVPNRYKTFFKKNHILPLAIHIR